MKKTLSLPIIHLDATVPYTVVTAGDLILSNIGTQVHKIIAIFMLCES